MPLSPTTIDDATPDAKRPFRPWGIAVRLTLLIAVLWLMSVRVHLPEVRHAFLRLRPGYLIPVVMLLSPLAVLLRALRWRRLLPGGEHLRVSTYAGAYVVGVLANSLLLGKLGDLVKARFVCDSRVEYGRSLAVVVIDRLLEGTALLLVFAAVLLNSSLPRWTHRLACGAALVSVGALMVLRVLFHHRDRFLSAVKRALRHFPVSISRRLLALLRQLLAGCEALTDHRRVLAALLYALAVWGVETATVALFLTAFSIPAPAMAAAPLILTVLNFGTLVPISPGSVGIYQLLCAFALSLWGVDRQLAFAFGVAMQTVLFVPLYLGGLAWILALKWSQDKKEAARSWNERVVQGEAQS